MSDAIQTTRRIDDESLAMLLDEVSAMAATGRALDLGLVDIEDAALGKFGKAARQVRSGIARGEQACDVIAALSPRYREPIRVAMHVMAETGSTEPIDEAVRLIRDANEHRQQMWLAAINPMINVVIAATVLFFVMPMLLVSIAQAELIKPAFAPSVREIQQTFASNFMLAAGACVIVIGLFAGLLYWMLTRSVRGINTARDHATFCRWLAMQVTCSVATQRVAGELTIDKIMDSAATVVGVPFREAWSQSIENVRAGACTSDAIAMPPQTPEPIGDCVVDLVSGRRDGESVAVDLRQLSEQYQQQSLRHRAWWINVLPRWIAGAVMLAIIVVMLKTMAAPLFDVIGKELR